MLREPRRLASAAVAVVIGVAFVAATLLLGASLSRTMNDAAAAQLHGASVIVATDDHHQGAITPEDAAAVRRIPGVTDVAIQAAMFQPLRLASRTVTGEIAVGPVLSARTTLVSGTLPASADQAAVSTQLADRSGTKLGDTVSVTGRNGTATPFTVTAIVRPGRDSGDESLPRVWVSAQAFAERVGAGFNELQVHGGDVASVRQALVGRDGLVIRSYADEVAQREKALTSGVDVLQDLLLAFAAIAVTVSTMVIANTFSITVAHRTRQLALLRCVGATRAQVMGSVLAEATILGTTGSVAGLGLGIAVAAVAVQLSHATASMAIDALTFSAPALIVPLLVGIIVTTLAALSPALRATRIAPLAALRPPLESPAAGRAGVVRTAVGAILTLGGTAALLIGATRPSLVTGLAGGLVSFLGIVLLAPIVVPAALRLLGVPLRRTGVPAELAVDNARRNPRRAAATASALLIGVTLITMMSVGASSAQATQQRALDREFPTDALVTGSGRTLAPGTREDAQAVAGVSRAAEGRAARVAVNGKPVQLFAVTPVAGVFRSPDATAGLGDGVILLDAGHGIRDGDQVTVAGDGATQTLTARVSSRHLRQAVVTPATAERLGNPGQPVLFVRFDEHADGWTVIDGLQEKLSGRDVQVSGVSMGMGEITQVVDMILYVVTGLLAVSVLIALIGVGNTLGLSVVERTQELGLLRALGLTRGQLRRMIGLEAATTALVAVVLGLLLGGGYGVAGVYAMMKGRVTVVVAVPWLRLAVVAAVAVAAGWVASVLPSRRAATVAPTTALAAD